MMIPVPWLSSERERLDRFRRGDPRILAEVYEHYAPGIAKILSHGFAFSSGDKQHRFVGYRTPFDIDDALQETFLRAFREKARLSYDGLRPYGAFLATMTRNIVIDGFRREKVANRAFEEVLSVEEPPPPAPSPEEVALTGELKRIIDEFKRSRSEEERTLIGLRLEQGASRAEVSAATGLSAMQVRTREKRLREDLFDFLTARGLGPDEVTATAVVILLLYAGAVLGELS